MMDATIRPYLIRAVCHKFLKDINNKNETICSSIDEYPELEDDIQKQSGYYLMYYRILLNVPPPLYYQCFVGPTVINMEGNPLFCFHVLEAC